MPTGSANSAISRRDGIRLSLSGFALRKEAQRRRSGARAIPTVGSTGLLSRGSVGSIPTRLTLEDVACTRGILGAVRRRKRSVRFCQQTEPIFQARSGSRHRADPRARGARRCRSSSSPMHAAGCGCTRLRIDSRAKHERRSSVPQIEALTARFSSTSHPTSGQREPRPSPPPKRRHAREGS